MQRSYPKRYSKSRIDGYLDLIAERFGYAGDVILEGELDPGWSEFVVIDDAAAFPTGMTNDPGCMDGILSARADVVYIDEEFGVVRFSGPVADRSPAQSIDAAVPLSLPVLLWRAGIEPGVWISVSGRPYGEGDYLVMLIRVTRALLERGRDLSGGLARGERTIQ